MSTFTTADARALLADAFAPWVQDLALEIEGTSDGVARFTLPGGAHLMRQGGAGGGVVCGQAIGAAADTCSVLALAMFNGRFRACTTVDMTTHFLRPLSGDAALEITALSNGRRMATTRAEFRGANGKLAAAATCAFAYLED